LAAVSRAHKSFYLYPDGDSASLRKAIAKKWSVAPERVIVGAGSDELIELLGKTFLAPNDSIVVSDHAFTRYRMAGELMGADVVTVPMRHYSHNLSAMGHAVRPNTKMVFVANPNNPTGTYNTQFELEHLLQHVAALEAKQKRRILVVADEAYYEYAKALQRDYPDTMKLQKRFPNLVILRTFSKIYALAGLRAGYAFADPLVIEALDRVRPPFNMNTAAQVAAEASLSDAGQVTRGINLIKAERRKMLPALARMGLPVVPSVANFILIDVSPRQGRQVFEALLDRGVIVRSVDEYGFRNHIRVTYGLPDQNQTFLKALREVLAA
jgi:histidinol-phosphate aminotransferase